MTISQSGSAGTGRITCTNEANLTLAQIAAAVSGCTELSSKAFHIDRDMEFINCDFTMDQESLTMSPELSNSIYGNASSRRPAWAVDANSSMNLNQSILALDADQPGGGFIPWWGSDGTGRETGPITVTECVFWLGDFAAKASGVYLRVRNASETYVFTDNQFVGGDPIRGWGSVDGTVSSVIARNKSYGTSAALLTRGTLTDNFAQDADVYTAFNTKNTLPLRIEAPQGGNFARGTIMILLRADGTYDCTVNNSDLPKTFINLNPPSNNNRRANLDWTYNHDANVTDDFDGLPEQNVRLDIVPTVASGPSVQTTKFTDANGDFTTTEIFHSRDFFRGNNAAVNTQYGPFRIRYAKYGFVFQDRSGDTYDNARGPETPRLLRDASIVEPLEATVAAYTNLDNLDEIRDRWHYERLADLFLGDTVAAGGGISTNGNDVVINSGAGQTWNNSGGTLTIRPSGTLAAGTTYNTFVVDSGDTLTATTPISANLNVAGTANVPDVDDLTGSLTLSGTLNVTSAGGGTLPSGSATAAGRITVSAASSNDRFNATAFTFDAATVIENTSGQPIIVELNAGQQEPTKLETSGTVTFETPTVRLTVEGLVIGGTFSIFDDEDGDASNSLGTLLATEGPIVGTSFNFDHRKGGDRVVIQMVADGFEEVNRTEILSPSDQTIVLLPTSEVNV